MKIRVISLLLVLALSLPLLLSSVSADSVSAATTPGEQLQQQIRQTYATARRRSGRYSFNGWCGSLVNWQTYLLGIDTAVHGCDGKNEYDLYANRSITCGGYAVNTYPASHYSLQQALNAITRNGELNVYNILVGFQRTNTQAGQVYGHALMIHGIIDGTVYFMECFDVSLNGTYYAEGSPISCSIEDFCTYYNRWTVFDGAIYFGVKTYAQVCTAYSANMTALVTADTDALTEPEDPGVHQASGVAASLVTGETVTVSGLYQTPGGDFWYQLALDGATGYVPADAVIPLRQEFSDLTLSDVRIPSTARKSAGVVLQGQISTLYSTLDDVQILVYGAEGGDPVLHASMAVDGKSASLSDGKLDRDLTFRKLEAGTYRILVRVSVSNTVLENGEPVRKAAQVDLWQSELRIITGWNQYYTVTFNGNGGTAALQQTVYQKGEQLSGLPEATRPGYRFLGWTLSPESSDLVTAATLPQESVTLYAQWQQEYRIEEDLLSAAQDWSWQQAQDGSGFFCTAYGIRFFRNADGSAAEGWKTVDGRLYWRNRAGVLHSGWLTLGEDRFYLDRNGAAVQGWLEIDGTTHYFDETGKLHSGWLSQQEQRYYLDENGTAVQGWQTIDGETCYFGDDGALQLAQKGSADGSFFVVYDRQAAETYVPADASLLLG